MARADGNRGEGVEVGGVEHAVARAVAGVERAVENGFKPRAMLPLAVF